VTMNTIGWLSLALVASAPALKDAPKKPNDLTGDWVLKDITIAGTILPPSNLLFTFGPDGKWIVVRDGNEVVTTARSYKFDPKADPPTVELFSDISSENITRREGIYKIEGDTLTMCVAKAKDPRPTRFDSTRENGHTVYVLKRKTKD